MKKTLTIFIFLFLLFAQEISYAQNILTEMSKREDILRQQLLKENDQAKRSEILDKLQQIQQMYYDPDIKQEMIYQSNPTYFKKAKRKSFKELNTIKIDSENPKANQQKIEVAPASATDLWNNYSAENKNKYCRQIKDSCDNQKNLENCRFVFRRCKGFLPELEYQDFVNKFTKR